MKDEFARLLTVGAIERMKSDSEVDKPVLQILHTREINQSDAHGRRARAYLWDGVEEYSLGMVSSQMLLKYEKDLQPFCLIRVNSYHANVCKDKLVMVLMDFEIVAKSEEVGEKIIPDPNAKRDQNSSTSKQAVPKTPTRAASRPRPTGTPQTPRGTPLTPISALNPYQSKWTIKARVSNKSPIKTWSKASSEGKLFNFEVFDDTADINITGFNEQVDNYFDLVQPKKVYFISGCVCKAANKQFRSSNNDYELTLTKFSKIELCEEACEDIPEQTYAFIKVSDLESQPPDNLVDVCAIVQSVGDMQTFNRKSDGKPFSKRDVQVCDDSNKSITLTLWNEIAATFEGHDNPCVVLSKARISTFNGGISISTGNSTMLDINPDLEEVTRLHGWWNSEGKHKTDFDSIKSSSGSDFGQEWMDFKVLETKSDQAAVDDKPIYVWNRVTVVMFNKENALYKACANSDCNKKVQDQGGNYRCEKCNSESPNFKWRIILKLSLSDAVHQFWATAFNETAEQILGVSAPTLGEYNEEDKDRFDEVFAQAMFKEWHMKFKGKMDVYQEERRFQLAVMQAKEVTLTDDSKHMLKSIQELIKKL